MNNLLFIMLLLATTIANAKIGYKCGEGASPIAFQQKQCPNDVIEHKVLRIGNLIKLIDSGDLSASDTLALRRDTADSTHIIKIAEQHAELVRAQKEQERKRQEVIAIAENARTNAQAWAQAEQYRLLKSMNGKLNYLKTEQIATNTLRQQEQWKQWGQQAQQRQQQEEVHRIFMGINLQ
jgi:hypothetical protein